MEKGGGRIKEIRLSSERVRRCDQNGFEGMKTLSLARCRTQRPAICAGRCANRWRWSTPISMRQIVSTSSPSGRRRSSAKTAPRHCGPTTSARCCGASRMSTAGGCCGRPCPTAGYGTLVTAGCAIRLRASTATTVPGATASAVIDAAIPTLPLPPPLPAAHVLDNPARMAVAFGIPPPLPSLELTWPSPSYSPLDEPLLPTPRTLSLCGIIQARGS